MNIEKEELERRLKIAEPYNNKDVPQYVWNIINAIPDAERVGHWIYVGTIENTWRLYRCSICGCQSLDGGNYCSDCGARMEGEQNDKG